MTRDELNAVWTRYMHRSDIQGDLDTTYLLASERITERLLFSVVDIDDILANSPRMLVHAGLIYLHELAQDDEGGARETQLFENAVRDFSLRHAINNAVAPQMADPYRSDPNAP